MQFAIVTDILWRSLALFLLIGAFSGGVVALLLIFRPQWLVHVNHHANRWVSMRRVSHWMDRSVSLERWLYRHHRLLGLFIMLGAAYMLFYFGWRFERTLAVQELVTTFKVNRLLLEMLVQVLALLAIVGAVAALIVGIIMGLRPSLLRGVEARSNQWVSSRRATKEIDISRNDPDGFFLQHAQKSGWLLLLGSIYLFFVMLRWLL